MAKSSEGRNTGHISKYWNYTKQKYLVIFVCLLYIIGSTDGLRVGSDKFVELEKEDLRFLFGDKEAPPHSLINIRSRPREKRSSETLTEDPGLLDVTLEDEGEQIEFELRPNSALLSPTFELVVRGDDGVTRERGITRPACVFMGIAKGRPETTAALSNCDGKGFVSVTYILIYLSLLTLFGIWPDSLNSVNLGYHIVS
ncbi:hypothetical protein SK128_015229 [Halocaridina rubra]|uniref:Peptidase M12B propeptide domain-containing protein n=1 Tax=Halocaridina rubra TaxID=373956 RepID=A0AAN8XTS1_HALRR